MVVFAWKSIIQWHSQLFFSRNNFNKGHAIENNLTRQKYLQQQIRWHWFPLKPIEAVFFVVLKIAPFYLGTQCTNYSVWVFFQCFKLHQTSIVSPCFSLIRILFQSKNLKKFTIHKKKSKCHQKWMFLKQSKYTNSIWSILKKSSDTLYERQ